MFCNACGQQMTDHHDGIQICKCGQKVYYDPPSDLPPPGYHGTIHLLTPMLLAAAHGTPVE